MPTEDTKAFQMILDWVKSRGVTETDIAAVFARMAAEVADARELNYAVTSGLRWTGDGYEWEPPHGDYRERVEDAIRRGREYVAELKATIQSIAAERDEAQNRLRANGK